MRPATWRAASGRRSMRLEAVAFARRAIGLASAAIVLAGCVAETTPLDHALPVVLRVTTSATSVDVDAPGWLADVSAVYLCPSAPPALPDASSARLGWTPGGDCHDFGRHPSPDGLTLSLPVADLAEGSWPTFEAAQDWYLLVLDLDGELVSNAVRSRFHAPKAAAAS